MQPTEFAGGVGGETQQSQVAGREVALYHHWASLSHSNSRTRVSVPESNVLPNLFIKNAQTKKQKDQKNKNMYAIYATDVFHIASNSDF